MIMSNEKEFLRKEGRKRGMVTQKMVSFRCDDENINWLEQQPNKGRYINNLIRTDMAAHNKD